MTLDAKKLAVIHIVKKELGLTASVPSWREQLILKGKKRVEAKPEAEEKVIDLKTLMSNAIIDIENELEDLKRKLSAGAKSGILEEQNLDRLKYIHDELRSLFA